LFHDICTKHGYPFTTVERECKDRDDALTWIIHNQFGRRNLPDSTRAMLAVERLAPLIAAKAKANQQANGRNNANALWNSAKRREAIAPIKTSEVLAKAAGMSSRSIERTIAVVAKAPEPVKAALRAGETTINRMVPNHWTVSSVRSR
jgi:hypothetical protein